MPAKIAFFDIDGTLTSEVDGRVPADAAAAIAGARANGNLMFINTGRCFQNVESASARSDGTDMCVAAAQIFTAAAGMSCMSRRRIPRRCRS